MRYHVVTDKSGKVIAHGRGSDPAGPGPHAIITPLPGQTVYDLELPDEHASKSLDELHQFITGSDWQQLTIESHKAS